MHWQASNHFAVNAACRQGFTHHDCAPGVARTQPCKLQLQLTQLPLAEPLAKHSSCSPRPCGTAVFHGACFVHSFSLVPDESCRHVPDESFPVMQCVHHLQSGKNECESNCRCQHPREAAFNILCMLTVAPDWPPHQLGWKKRQSSDLIIQSVAGCDHDALKTLLTTTIEPQWR